MFLKSKQYNLSDNNESERFANDVKNIVDKESTIAGVISIPLEHSKATVRFTNSRGFDFKYYANGWKGNQYVKPKSLSNIGKYLKFCGNSLSFISSMNSFNEMFKSNSSIEMIDHGVDGVLSILSMYNIYTFVGNIYYQNVMKNYPEIRNNVNKNLEERANYIKKGGIPIGFPGIPFK